MKEKRSMTGLMTAILMLLTAMFSTSCEVDEEREHLLLVTTIYPYELIVQHLATEEAEVVSIIPSNATPHTYSPKPADVKLLEDADLVISNGADLEAYLEGTLNALADKHLDAFTFIRDILHFKEEGTHVDEHGHYNNHNPSHNNNPHQHALNPHFWLDPLLIIPIAEGIAEALMITDPANAGVYIENLEALKDEMENLHERIAAEREEVDKASVLHFHDAFHYFNKRYDIHSAGVIVKSPGREPTAAELVEIGKQINEHDVTVIFIEPQFDPKQAEVIAEEYDLALDILDPIGNEDIAPHSIGDLILYNWIVIRRNLN